MMTKVSGHYVGSVPNVNKSAALQIVSAQGVPRLQDQDKETLERLARLKPMDYDRIRKAEAKSLGIQVKTLDDMVKQERPKEIESKVPFTEIEMFSEPVMAADVLDEVYAIIRRFVVMDEEQAVAAALWVAHTYLVDEAEVSPILVINAPEKGCGKTLCQEVIGSMSYRPLPAANATPSSIFRAVEMWRPTLLIDEADTYFRENSDMHGMINAGYKRGGFVLRTVTNGDDFTPQAFSVYGAKSIAGIALERCLPDATMSRGIPLCLRRKLPNETVQRKRQADKKLFETTAAKLARFAYDNSQRIRDAHPHLPDELSDRAQDNWEPLLAIAECAGEEWLQRATAAALTLSSASEASASTGNELLADIQHVFEVWQRKKGTKISTADLIAALVDDDEKSWATYNRGKPLTPRQLAKQLAVYGIKSKTVRMGHANTPKGYELSQFDDVFNRYLSGSPDAPQQRNESPEPSGSMELRVADIVWVSDEMRLAAEATRNVSEVIALEDAF